MPDPSPSARRRLRFPKKARVRTRSEFERVKAANASIRDAVLRIGYALRPLEEMGPARLGLAVGRRLGDAPTRNRIKRVLREAFRKNPGLFPEGLDLVVIPMDKHAARDFDAVQQSLLGLAKRLHGRLRAATTSAPLRPNQNERPRARP